MASSVYYATNTGAVSNNIIPTTSALVGMSWIRRTVAGDADTNNPIFGFTQQTGVYDELAGNWGMQIGSGSGGHYIRASVTYWNNSSTFISSSTDWKFVVLQRSSGSSTISVRVFRDDGPTFTKEADLTVFGNSAVQTAGRLVLLADINAHQYTGLRVFTGSTFTDDQCRLQATYRFPPTHPTASLYDYWILETATQLTGSVNSTLLSGSTPTLSASSAPVSILPAQRLRYVNTNSTVGGNGTTNETTGANRAYPSLRTVWLTEPDTLLTTDQYLEVQCGGGADIQTDILYFAKTTDNTRYVILKPFPGNEATVPFDSNRYHISGSSFSVFSVRNMIIDGLQFNVSGSTDAVGQGATSGTGSILTIRNCHIINRTGTGIRITPASGSQTFIINNFVSASGIGINTLTALGEFITHSIYNNTAICGGGSGGTQRAFFTTFYGANATIRFKNNLGYNLVSSAFGREATPAVEDIVNNASNDNTAFANTVGGATLRNRTFTFRNSASGDYRLAGNDTGAQSLGANLSTDSSYAFSTDFGGQNRNRSLSWDIGADQVQIGYTEISSTTGNQFTISTSSTNGKQVSIRQ